MSKSNFNFSMLMFIVLVALVLDLDDRVDTLEQQNSELVTMLHEKLADKGGDLCK